MNRCAGSARDTPLPDKSRFGKGLRWNPRSRCASFFRLWITEQRMNRSRGRCSGSVRRTGWERLLVRPGLWVFGFERAGPGVVRAVPPYYRWFWRGSVWGDEEGQRVMSGGKSLRILGRMGKMGDMSQRATPGRTTVLMVRVSRSTLVGLVRWAEKPASLLRRTSSS